MRLYLMRHGPAEDFSSSGRDQDRPLSREGGAAVSRVAAALRGELAGRSLPRPRIVSSPLLRARQTAEIVAAMLADPRAEPGPPALELDPRLAPAEDPPLDLAEDLLSNGADGADTLWVSHQPGLERLARALLAGRPEAELRPLGRGFRTAMVLSLELASPTEPAPGDRSARALRLAFSLDPLTLDLAPSG